MTRRFQRINRPLQVTTTGEAIGTGIGILAGVIVLVIVGLTMATLFSVKAKATWRPEFANSPPSVQLWFKNAPTTPAARARIGILTCCEQAERLMTKFVASASGDWSYYPDPKCTRAGCSLLPIPNDVVHEDVIKALDPADNDLPQFRAMRREGVLFIWKGAPSCFWPPEPGG